MSIPLKPLNRVTFVDEDGVKSLEASDVSIELVGGKGFGLSSLPEHWTLPFIVISSNFYASAITSLDRSSVIRLWAGMCREAAASCMLNDNIIIRSSAVNESIKERGRYKTISSTLDTLEDRLTEYVDLTQADSDIANQTICLVIQSYIVASEKGHLSNERRCYKEDRDWQCQIEGKSGSEAFSINLRNWREKIDVQEASVRPLACNIKVNLQKALKSAAAWGKEKPKRLHFEWVWDGRVVYLVQVEEEIDGGNFNPQESTALITDSLSGFRPKLLKLIERDHARKYRKIHNVYVYLDLELPITPLYVLDDQDVIRGISQGEFSEELRSDLLALTKNSLVIRIDLDTDDQTIKQMLPRTHEVRALDEACEWLNDQADGVLAKSGDTDIAFIFHNFIPAESSAFAFAAPGERKVQIEALWGIPEGLYYNSHDKYTIDTLDAKLEKITGKESDYRVTSQINYKPFCVAPNEEGEWKTQSLVVPYDWKAAVTKDEWVRIIARDSRRIAEKENESVSIMWFVGVPGWASKIPVLPWFHEQYKKEMIPRSKNRRKKTPFDQYIEIENRADIDSFKRAVESGNKSIRQVLVRPNEEELLRDKQTLKLIGELAKKIDAVIMLEGATLSHAFYQLAQVGVTIHVENPFDNDVEKQEFNKLVRDDIPKKIESGGEHVKTKKLEGESLFRALREKLIEESFEVLDAKDHDAVLDELSDVLEVVYSIASHLGTEFSEIEKRKVEKKKKVGGFGKGLILVGTTNPSPSSMPEKARNLSFDFGDHDSAIVLQDGYGEPIKKWTDKREHSAATEVVLNIVTPILLENWEADTQEVALASDKNETIRATIKSVREGSKTRITLSVYASKQLDLFRGP